MYLFEGVVIHQINMGSCFSSSSSSSSSILDNKPVARVISLEGTLMECLLPVSVSQVLGENYNSWSCFVCDADNLLYNSYIPPLDSQEWLQHEHIYFMLPALMLNHPLTGLDMAALAVKASEALNNAAKDKLGKKRSSSRIQVMPVDGFRENTASGVDLKIFPAVSLPTRRRRGSSSSSYKQRLSTIVEDSE